MKRYHSETITCGLCDYEATNVENLETHQFTCETFKCSVSDCKKLVRSVSEIKQHINEDHKGTHVWIEHTK